jgi:hypothetical protein
MKSLKLILIVVVAVFCSYQTQAQSVQQRANSMFEKLSYNTAIPVYLSAMKT